MTTIILHDESRGVSETVVVPLSLRAAVEMVRRSLGAPDFELIDLDPRTYARVVAGRIEVFIYGFEQEAYLGETNRIGAALARLRS